MPSLRAATIGWGLALLALILWAGFFAWPKDPRPDQTAAQPPPGVALYPGGSGCLPLRLAQARATAQGQDERDRCAAAMDGYRLAQYDRGLQQRASMAAEKGVRVAYDQAKSGFLQTLFTIAAFGAAVWAAYAAWRAAVYAKDAAEAGTASAQAAQASLEHSRDVAIKQLRPYVALKGPDTTGPIPRNGVLNIDLKNFGQTPATHIHFSSGAEVRAKPVGDAIVPLDTVIGEAMDLAPGADQHLSVEMADLTDAQYAAIKSGAHALLLRYRLEYDLAPGQRDALDLTLWVDEYDLRDGSVRLLNDYLRAVSPGV